MADGRAGTTEPVAVAAAVGFHGVGKTFSVPGGGTYTVLHNLSLTVGAGEFVSIVGPTGGGKSTLLNLAAGLLVPDAGDVLVFGEPLRGLNRRASYLFQSDVLLPWKTAEHNVMLGLQFRRLPPAEARVRARDWLARVGLAGFENRYPHHLSGGMRRRVALAQALIIDPEILLMDEPFSALDVQTRQIMENDLLELWQEDRKTVVFVTHDLEEAIALADRVVVLSAGPASRVLGEYTVGLARPRDVAEIRLTTGFLDIYRRIWEQLRGEVAKAYAQRQR
ncbi:MAG: ABC transporter ATP-binding protein [Armatimonadetes bacterium]|nr:ABC transporter ATP-binding protein [Armatimonadota bacterium]